MAEFKLVEGFKCYAPELAESNLDFSVESFNYLYKTEESNFWFVSRNSVIKLVVEKYFRERSNFNNKFLEIGCGTGYVLKGLSVFPFLELEGAEIYLQGLKYAKTRLPSINLVQLDATNLPFTNEFEGIGTFDVLEHIEADELVIENIYKALKPHGLFFISVPQYMWMWSKTDEYACHKRRYSRKEIQFKLENAGFKIEYVSSFVFTLFPLMILSRIFTKKSPQSLTNMNDGAPELDVNPYLNRILRLFMRFDEQLIKWGWSLPFGGSLIVVARKHGVTISS